MARIGWLVTFVLAGSCAGPGFALDPHKAIDQFVHTAWTEKDGVPTSVLALAQTTDGYLWLGTSMGLFRFDGVRFVRFEPLAGEALPSVRIETLLAARDGGLRSEEHTSELPSPCNLVCRLLL